MAAQKEEFRDVHPIPGVPESPNTVKWAEDGTIAVAAGNTITLVHPNRFGNAVGLAIGGDAPRANQPITAPGEPAQGQSNIHFDLTLSTRIMASTASVKPSVRAIAWSPLGCATQGTCLLAAVSDDHHVHIYGPTCSLSPEWACLSSLMDGVVDHLKQSDWADVDAGGQAPAEDPGTLRLRGGARGKQPAIRSSTADAVVRKVADDADNTEAAAARGDGTGAASGSAAAPAAKRRKSSAPQQASAGDAIDAAVQRRGPLGPEAGVPVLDFQGQERLPRIIAGLAAAQYFFALRRREDPDDLPDYPQPSTHIKDRDLELLEEATAAVWAVNADVLEAAGILKPVLDKECRIQMRFAWDRMNNTMKSGFEYMGLPGGKQVEASSEESTDDSSEEELGDDGGPAQRAERRARREALVEPPTQAQGAAAPAAPQPVFSREPYAVPEEFTWRDLPPVDPANRSTLRRTLVEGSVRRFLALRREEPAELLPRYEASNVHLRGVDAWLVERVNKEYTSAHAAGLEALGYDAKKFANYWSQRLRGVWDRVSDTLKEPTFLTDDAGLAHPEGPDPPVPILDEEKPLAPAPYLKRPRGRAAAAAAQKAAPSASRSAPAPPGTRDKGGTLSSEVYQRRLLSVSAISVAWSPVVVTAAGRCCFVAVGTKEGRVWVWRYSLPTSPTQPGPKAEEEAAMAKRLELIGSVRGNLTWATVMAWALLPETSPDEGPTLVLAIGSSDGSVVLCAAPAATLAAARLVEGASGEELMSRLPPAILPDLRLVSAMDLCLRYPVVSGEQRSSSPQLVIAVGKSMGTVCVWTSERLPTTPPTGKGKAAASDAGGGILEALGKGSLLMPPRIGALASLGTSTVTGIACTAAGELVVACSRDGAVNSWSLATPGGAAGGGKLQACPPPVPCVRRKSKDVGFGAFGVAGSPGGAFMAVYRLALPPGIHFVKHLQIHQKVTQGLIQLYRLAGPGAPMTDVVGAASVCCEAWAAERLSPAALWDAMQLVVLGQTWMNSAALTAGCKDLAETLEKRFFAAQNGKKLPLDVPSHTWRMLRAAVTVRRAALPMLPAGPAQAEWAALLDQNELLLLQRRLHQILAAPLGEGATVEQQRLTRLLAADCVVVNVNHPCLMEELVPLATKAYRDCNETPPGAANDFAVPPRPITAKATGADAPACAMQGPGAAAALSAVMRPDMQLPRCPASLQVSLGGWVCRCCKRAYEVLPEGVEGERGSGLECLLCGGLVGVSLPEFLVTPPCM